MILLEVQIILNHYLVENESDNCKVICDVIYHHPGSSHDHFINKLNYIMNEILKLCKYVFVMGDFNINLLKSNERHAIDLVNLFHGFGIMSLINKPTRITENSSTLIDHLIIYS